MGTYKKRQIRGKSIGMLLRWLTLSLLFVGTHALAQSAGTVTYVYTDPQGTPLAEADASGNITATFDYTPYGTTALGSPPKGPGYTGHVNDPETNLVYMQGRYYDPATGRFLSVDPVTPGAGNAFSFNRYVYALNNPVSNTDPTGRQAETLTAADAARLQACGGGCSMVMMDGHYQMVGGGASAQSILAQQNGGTVTNYNPATRQQMSVAMDNTTVAAATVSRLSGGTFAPADVVDEVSAVLAWAFDPSWDRAITIATGGMFAGLKVEAKGNEAASAAIERAERANTAKDLLTATQPNNTPSSSSAQSSPQSNNPGSSQARNNPATPVVAPAPALHPLGQ